jgi:hypothetical protein
MGYVALVGVAQAGHVQGQQELAVTHQVGDADFAGHLVTGLGVAAQVEGFGHVHHQQAHGAVALKLDGEAAGLLQVAADDAGYRTHGAEQVAHGGRVVARGQQGLPDVVEPDEGAADVEIFKQKALEDGGAHSVVPAGLRKLV